MQHVFRAFWLTVVVGLLSGAGVAYASGDCGSGTLVEKKRWTYTNDGRVRDNETGLEWMRCSVGQMWDGKTCRASQQWNVWFNWEDATYYALKREYAGHDDWRLPTVEELETLLDETCGDLAIDQNAFPATLPDRPYWTSSEWADNPDYVWVVEFGYNDVRTELKDNASFAARLVRGHMKSKAPATQPETDASDAFEDPYLTDGIHDPTSNTLWQLERPNEALEALPKTERGTVNWVEALNQGVIRPRTSLEHTGDDEPFNLNIVMSRTKLMPFVLFPHFTHTQWLTCSNCHPAIFTPKVGSNRFKMDDILRGEACGKCHGKVAFSPLECERCHRIRHDGMDVDLSH